jgi:hypothetical protein
MRADAHRTMVQSAVDANFNTLRVWGGGMFMPDAWYDACDELGVMVYHDMQYAQSGHSPKNTTSQDAELRHQVRRLSHHPSIVMYDGCNECRVVMDTPTAIYATFVMTTVAQVRVYSPYSLYSPYSPYSPYSLYSLYPYPGGFVPSSMALLSCCRMEHRRPSSHWPPQRQRPHHAWQGSCASRDAWSLPAWLGIRRPQWALYPGALRFTPARHHQQRRCE